MNRLDNAQAVAVGDAAGEEIAHGGEPDVGVRADVGLAHSLRRQGQRAGVVEEDERANHPPVAEGKDPGDGEPPAEFGPAGVDRDLGHGLPSRMLECRR
jgi:hypothetical protein